MKQRIELRNQEFMTHDLSAEHKSRETFSVTLRKKKRNEFAEKNRKLKPCLKTFECSSLPEHLANEIKELKGEDSETLNFIDICKLLAYTNDLDSLLEYLNFSINKNNELSTLLVDLNLVETIVLVLDPDKDSKTLALAVLVICNILATNENVSEKFFELDLVPRLLSVVNPQETRLTENILWCFANIATESEKAAQNLINESVFDIVERLEKDFRKNLTPSLAEAFGYFLTSLSKFTLILDMEKAKKIVALCKFYIQKFEGITCKNFVLTLNNLARVDDFLEVINEEHLIQVVIDLIQIPSLRSVSLKFIKHVSSGDNKFGVLLVNHRILPIFARLIESEEAKITEAILFTLSNLACVQELSEVLVSHEIFLKVLEKLSSKTLEIQQEASFFIKTFMIGSKTEAKVKALNMNLLSLLEEGLQSADQVVLKNLLISVYHLLLFFAQHDFVTNVEALANVINRLTSLASSKFEEISQLAEELLALLN